MRCRCFKIMDPPLEKVEPKFCSTFLKSGVEPNQPLEKVETKQLFIKIFYSILLVRYE